MHNIQTQADLDQFLARNERVFLKFTATWCGPCKAIQPHLDKYERTNPHVAFAAVDIDESQPLATKYQIQAVPSFISFHNGKEVFERVKGADMRGIDASVTKLAKLGTNASTSQEAKKSDEPSIPKGFESLNDSIDFTGAELLNVDSLEPSQQLRALFGKGSPSTKTDADAQLLTFVPLMNKAMVSKLFLKIPSTLDGTQRPVHVKVWASLPSALSFEDAVSNKATFECEIAESDENGWVEIPLRYVLFQNVSSLLVFLTGEDEDEPTEVSRIVVVGRKGDSRSVGKLQVDEED